MDNILVGNNNQIIAPTERQANETLRKRIGKFFKKTEETFKETDHSFLAAAVKESKSGAGMAEKKGRQQPVKKPQSKAVGKKPQNATKALESKNKASANKRKTTNSAGAKTDSKKVGRPPKNNKITNSFDQVEKKLAESLEQALGLSPKTKMEKSTEKTGKKVTKKTKSTSRKNTNNKNATLAIIPLGGLGEVGKNMTAIKYGNHIIVIDGGMSFPDEDLLGIDLVIPDYNYLLENRNMVKVIFVTHGHEDHIGALPYVLSDLNVPVYGGKLTLGLLNGKLKEHHLENAKLHEVKSRDVIRSGPFRVEFIRVSHSIPDAFAIAIHTPIGTILHTGDFKLDMSPVDGQVMDLVYCFRKICG